MPFEWWVWPVLLGPFIGSFLGVIVTRLETPRSIVVGRSACASCGAPLGVRDLIPIASYLASLGRCRHCGARIDLFHPAIEIGALFVALWSAWVAPDPTVLWASCILGWTLLALAGCDLTAFLLPDFLTLPLIAVGLLANWAIEPDMLPQHLAGAAAGYLFVMLLRTIYKALRKREGMGLGDAKLLAAGGAWVSWTGLPGVLLLAALTGLAFALFLQRRNGKIRATDRVPFGAFLCIGLWVTWLYGPLQFEESPMRFGVIGLVGTLLAPAPLAFAAETPAGDASQGCVDVQIGNDRTPNFNCINQQLQKRAEREHALQQIDAPLGPHASPAAVGLATDAAARERMGANFGKSPFPQRPARIPTQMLSPNWAAGK